MKRRNFLKMGVTGMGVASGLATNLASFNAFAADTSDYRALVCVFLAGGHDGHDLMIPYDLSSSNSYESIRAPLLNGYGQSRRRDNLLRLDSTGSTPSSGSVLDGRSFAMAQEMKPLRDLYLSQKMAVVGNVGPLIEPTTASSYSSAALPPRLFSHNDQASIWMASNPEGAETGWGGKFADIMQAAHANTSSSFTTVRVKGDSLFVTGLNTTPFVLSTTGGLEVDGLDEKVFNSWVPSQNYTKALYGEGLRLSSPFQKDLVNSTGKAVDDNLLVSEVFANGIDVSSAFPSSDLGQQLQVVAKMIANRDALGARRQIFLVQDGGYDHHGNQAIGLPERQADIANSMRAFYDETVRLGVENEVLQFTASDFGRTLVPNASGTDHGWGSHHLVVGGGINGGLIYGDIPDTEGNASSGNNNYHLGRGRLVPQLSVDQYAFTLARWFGLSLGEAWDVLPNARNFNVRSLYGLYNSDYNQYGGRV